MKKLAFLSLLVAVLFACAEKKAETAAPSTTPVAEPSDEIVIEDIVEEEAPEEAGPSPIIDGVNVLKIFKTSCAVCHGVDGKLGANGAKDLTVSEVPLEERIQIITNGKNLMTPFGSILKPEEIQAVAKFTMQLKK